MPNYTVSQDIDDFMKSDDDAAARTELGLGSAATSNTGDFATSVQGGKADSALQPSDIGSTVQAQDSVLDNTTASFTTEQESKLTAITGTNTGDQDLSGLQPILTEGAFVDGDKTKLDGITGTNTGDQDLSGLQSILTEGAFVDGDKTKLDGITGTNTGDQDLSGLQSILTEGAFVDGDKTKLDAITGTNTGDQDLSGLQSILTEGAFVDGDKTKLDGITGTNTGDQDLSALATKANVLELDNTVSFTPSANFHPATKKYVDDNAGGGGSAETAETSVYIDAGAMLAKDGEADASTGADNGTNNSVDWYNVATGETLYAKIAMPPQWDKGVIDVELYWTITGGTIGENVKWEVAAQAGGDDDAWDIAFPAPTATLDDPILADGDIHQITASSITVGGSAIDGDILHLEIARAAAGATAASQDARLLGIRLKYSNSLLQNWYSWKLGNETADATIGIKNTWYAPAAGKVHAVAAGTASATSGSALALDVHKTGTTIFSTGITIDDAQTDTSNATTPAVLTTDPTTFNAGDKFEFEVDTTTAGGAGLHCDLLISWD